jgi:hypothetical protein
VPPTVVHATARADRAVQVLMAPVSKVGNITIQGCNLITHKKPSI